MSSMKSQVSKKVTGLCNPKTARDVWGMDSQFVLPKVCRYRIYWRMGLCMFVAHNIVCVIFYFYSLLSPTLLVLHIYYYHSYYYYYFYYHYHYHYHYYYYYY